MRSSFFELGVAVSGLYTARGNLDVVSHNVANSNVAGYSRQYAEQRASRPLTFYNGKGMIGTGSEIFGVAQVRSFYLDKRYWAEMPTLGEYAAKKTQIDVMERVFNEMSTTGLATQFNNFFDLLEDLSTTSGDTTYRTNLLTNLSSINTFFANTYDTLSKQQADINREVRVVTDTINSLGIQIRTLNEQISIYELDGSFANDLRDQRARLCDELSRYVNIEVIELESNADYAAGLYPEPEDRGKSQKKFCVLINGAEFVKGVDINRLECRARTTTDNGQIVSLNKNAEDNDSLYDIYWAGSNSKFNIYHPNLSGELRGLIDLRDGNNKNYCRISPFDSAVDSYDATTRKLTVTIDHTQTRADLASSGEIKALNTVTGRYETYNYKDYVYDPTTKTASFTIISPNAATLTNADFEPPINMTVGEASSYKGIPYYMSRLNDLVRTFATAINEGKHMDGSRITGVIGHVDAYDLYGNQTNKFLLTYVDTGGEIVNASSAGYNIYELNARNIQISSLISTDNRLFGAASHPESESGVSDNRAVLSFLNIRSSDKLFLEGNILDFINGMAGELAIDGRQATSFEKNYSDVTAGINNQRISVSGVSINEEMMAMIKYQQQYQACAKLINIIDGIYDTTVNRIGLT